MSSTSDETATETPSLLFKMKYQQINTTVAGRATVDGRLCLLLQFHHGAGRMWSPFPRHVQHLLCCTDDGNMTARDVSRQSGWLEPLLCSKHSYQARQTHIHAVPWLRSSQTVTKPQGCLSFIMWHEHVCSCIYTTPLMQCLVSKLQGKWLEFRLQSCTNVRESRIFTSLLLRQSPT